MNLFISKLKTNKLIKNSSIFFLGSISGSIGNYIFHLLIGRILGPASYGILASLISLTAILAIPTGTLGLVSIKLASEIKVSKNYGELHFLVRYLLKKLALVGMIIFLFFCLFSSPLAHFLKIPSPKLIIILGFLLFLSFLIPLTRSILQGLQMFKALALNMAIEPVIKISFTLLLLLAGLKVYGALGAMIAATLIPFALSFKPLHFIFRHPAKNKIKFKRIFSYALPVFISLFGFTLLYNIDIIMVKHFFNAEEAGLYSALSKLGQIIFFATTAIAAVMFPMVAERYKKGEKHTYLVRQSLKIVGGLSILGVIFYFLFPELMIKALFGSAYLKVAPLVGLFALAMLFLALSNLLINYYLSIHKFKFIYILAIATILEIWLILSRHKSIGEIVMNLLISLFLLFIGLLIFYFLENKKALKTT